MRGDELPPPIDPAPSRPRPGDRGRAARRDRRPRHRAAQELRLDQGQAPPLQHQGRPAALQAGAVLRRHLRRPPQDRARLSLPALLGERAGREMRQHAHQPRPDHLHHQAVGSPVRKRFVAVAAMLVAASLAWPVGAQAHGLIQRANLPIPEWLFGWAAAIVLVVSFVALAVLWPTPQIDGNDGWRPLRRVGRFLGSQTLEDACQTVGAALFVLVLVAGFFGRQDVEHNIAPTFVFITFWVGLAFASVLFGDVFRAFNPWRAIGRATGAVLGGRPERRRRYPDWLGRWPAAAGLLGFAWLELASSGLSQVPHMVAIAAAVYSAFT